MNVLSHYILDRDNDSPYYMLGIVLPDIISNFNQKLRKSVFEHVHLVSMDHKQILDGIKRHYHVDALFHGSDFFSQYTGLIKEHILALNLSSFRYRTYFLAHVFLEMLLDRLLIKQSAHLLVEIYDTINSINQKTVSSYLISIGKADFQNEFFNTFTGFINRQYLYYYTDNEKFIRALVWMYNKVNPITPSPKEVQQLVLLTERLELKYKHEMLDIFSWLKKQLSGAKNV